MATRASGRGHGEERLAPSFNQSTGIPRLPPLLLSLRVHAPIFRSQFYSVLTPPRPPPSSPQLEYMLGDDLAAAAETARRILVLALSKEEAHAAAHATAVDAGLVREGAPLFCEGDGPGN